MSIALPNAFILGAQKSGTTTIAELLARHPDISLGQSKELNVFGCHDENARIHRFEHWQNPAARIRIDASTFYFPSPASMKRIRELCGDTMRALVILREPAARAVSAYWHHVSIGVEKRSPEAAFACLDVENPPALLQAVIANENQHLVSSVIQEKVRVSNFAWRFPDPLWAFRYISNSDYYRQLQHAFEILSRDRVLVVFTDELRENRGSLISQIAEFFGADPADFPETTSISDANVRQVPRKTFASDALRAFKGIVPQWIRDKIPRPLVQRYRSKVYMRPLEPNDVKTRLKSLFMQEDGDLSALLGKKLPTGWYGL